MQFPVGVITERRFSIQRAVDKKMATLEKVIDRLPYGDIVWLERIEKFWMDHDYLTEKQMLVLQKVYDRNTRVS
jgi:hypothetical protein